MFIFAQPVNDLHNKIFSNLEVLKANTLWAVHYEQHINGATLAFYKEAEGYTIKICTNAWHFYFFRILSLTIAGKYPSIKM